MSLRKKGNTERIIKDILLGARGKGVETMKTLDPGKAVVTINYEWNKPDVPFSLRGGSYCP
ncbi:hypothetical protein H8E65_00835 [Candidatus Bathyarchaeota archaeon]|nr:hypothetical protein [Candidatus Bathyarchaeota archaeon]MBL7079543.1 hypothetical protein [Candidatus Bathyarchaeota archaeon]